MSAITDAPASGNHDWYIVEHGQRKGPFATTQILELAQSETIAGDTLIWRKGFADWQLLQNTELGAYLGNNPPPVAATYVNNALAWTIAVAPLGYALLTGFIQAYELETPYEDHPILTLINFLVPAVINAALCLADERQLKRAGYFDKWLTLSGILLAPVYLFLRAKRLRQFPSYGIAWVACFVISTLMSLPGGFFLR
ncbi:GYF domain-containing protein [Bradyrhizobium oligotrophicum]|uniref:DUF4339 domain-containing protein n=1 Tax=Bradyrhizobium oligotrophicum TaxID=44255 RepID=UPI003EB982F9